MNNLEQGSAGISLAQSAPITQAEKPTPSTARFLQMLTPKGRADIVTAHEKKEQAARERIALGVKHGASAPLLALMRQPREAQPAPTAAPLPTPTVTAQMPREVAPVPTMARTRFQPQFEPETAERLNIIDSLTACLDGTAQPETAKKIYRTLMQLAFFSLMARGLPNQHVTRACFHLPLDLLAEYLGVDRTTVWRNIKPLIKAGLLDTRDHYGTLRGATAVTGKLWAVSLRPNEVLAGKRDKVKVTHDDMTVKWRDLEADVRAGRTAYALITTDEQKEAHKARQAERVAQNTEAKQRAAQRLSERQAAKARGEKVPVGRQAATINAAATRAARPESERPAPKKLAREKSVQQSSIPVKVKVTLNTLKEWVLAPFNLSTGVTLTVANGPDAVQGGLDAIWSIPNLLGLSKAQRGAAVEQLAAKLAATYQDGHNQRFWAWLLWQTLRAYDQGQAVTDSLCIVLARVFQDMKHEPAKKAAAVVIGELKKTGLYQILKDTAPTRVGAKPKAA